MIENYFIEKRDDYYLSELIYAVQDDLNMDELIDKAINTKDKNFIINCYNRTKNILVFTEDEIKKIKEKMSNIN